MSHIDKRKRAIDVPLPLWKVDSSKFWEQALQKESRLRIKTARESVRNFQQTYGAERLSLITPKSARRPSYVDDERRSPKNIDPRYHSMSNRQLFGLTDGLPSQGYPTVSGPRQTEDRSYGEVQSARFTHTRDTREPSSRYRTPPTSSMEIGWDAWGEVARLKKATRFPVKQSAMSNYAHSMLLPAGAPCPIGNMGGSDSYWRTNMISTLRA